MTALRDKKTRLFMVLGGIFITNAVVAELIGVKIFSLENSLGLSPVNLSIGDFILDFNLTAGAIIWPVVFITTDIINEYFGKKGVQQITFLTVGLIIYVFLVISVVTALSPAGFWLELNQADPEGNPFNINYAYNKIFLQGLGIIVGSLVAFLLGQLLDVFVFQRLRKVTGPKMIWLRATGSTLISQLLDSFVVLFIAFYIFGNPPWPFKQVLAVGLINYTYKFVVAVVLTPLLYLAHNIIDGYLGKEQADKMTNEASEDSQSFF
jgi:uncharacterized integral membrane protein (TIGR00697 family)